MARTLVICLFVDPRFVHRSLHPQSNAIGPPRKLQHLRFPYIWGSLGGLQYRRPHIAADINSTEPRHCNAFLLSHFAESAAIRVSADRGALTSAHFNSLPMYSGIPLPSHIVGCAAIRVSADRGALTSAQSNLLSMYRDVSTPSHIA